MGGRGLRTILNGSGDVLGRRYMLTHTPDINNINYIF